MGNGQRHKLSAIAGQPASHAPPGLSPSEALDYALITARSCAAAPPWELTRFWLMRRSRLDTLMKRIRNMSGRERALDSTRYAVRLGKARAHEIERHHYETRAEHEPTRPDHIEVEIERAFQHPQRRDPGLDSDGNHTRREQ